MKLAYPEWTTVLEWDALHPGSLVIEHPQTYLSVVSDLTAQEEGEGALIFSEKGQILSLKKSALLIRDLWSVDVNQKKLLNGVLGELKKLAREEYEADVQKLLFDLSALLTSLAQDTMLPLIWEEQPDIMSLLKAMDVRLESADSPFDRLLDYVDLAQAYLHTKLVVLIGVRTFLTAEEFEALCRDFANRELQVLFVDGTAYPMCANEKRLLIDSDRCEMLFA